MLAQVLRPGGPSELLSRHDSSAQALADSYTDLNSLLHFTVASFPPAFRLSLNFGWLGVLVWDLVRVMLKYWRSSRVLRPCKTLGSLVREHISVSY